MLLIARNTLLYPRIPVPIKSNLLLFPLAYVDTRYIPVVRAVIVVHTSVVGSWCRCVPLPVPRSTPALTVPRVAPTAGCLVPVGLPHAGRVASAPPAQPHRNWGFPYAFAMMQAVIFVHLHSPFTSVADLRSIYI